MRLEYTTPGWLPQGWGGFLQHTLSASLSTGRGQFYPMSQGEVNGYSMFLLIITMKPVPVASNKIAASSNLSKLLLLEKKVDHHLPTSSSEKTEPEERLTFSRRNTC